MNRKKIFTSIVLFSMMFFLFGCDEEVEFSNEVVFNMDYEYRVQLGDDSFDIDALITFIDEDGLDRDVNDCEVDYGGYDVDVVGTYTITVTYTDDEGMISRDVLNVYVEDKIAPVITLNGDNIIYLSIGSEYEDLGAVYSDNYDTEGEVVIDNTGLDLEHPGSYIITYSAQDSSGNDAEFVTRRVIVKDDEVPTFSVISSATITVGTQDVDLEIFVYNLQDNYDAAEHLTIDFVTDFDVMKLGEYDVFVEVTDSNGNSSSDSFTLVVEIGYHPIVQFDYFEIQENSISFAIEAYNDPFYENFKYTIYTIDETDNMVLLEGFEDITITREFTQVLLETLYGIEYVIEVSYNTIIDDETISIFSNLLEVEPPIINFYANVYGSTVTVYADVIYDDIERILVFDSEDSLVYESVNPGHPNFTISNLEGDMEYRVVYEMYSGNNVEFTFKTLPLVPIQDIVLNLKMYLFDQDYTNAGVSILIDGEYTEYAITEVVDGFGIVQVVYPHEVFMEFPDYITFDFYSDLENKLSVLAEYSYTRYYINPIKDRIYAETDIYYFEGQDTIYENHTGGGLIFNIVADVNSIKGNYSYIKAYDNNGGFYNVDNTENRLETHSLIQNIDGKLMKSILFIIEVNEFGVYDSALRLNGICPTYILDNSEVKQDGSKINFIVNGHCSVTQDYDEHMTVVAEEILLLAEIGVELADYVSNEDSDIGNIAYIITDESILVSRILDDTNLFDSEGNIVQNTGFIVVVNDTNIFLDIPDLSEICSDNYIRLAVTSSHDVDKLGIVGSFNDFDYNNPITGVLINTFGRGYYEFNICTTDTSGTFRLIYDNDNNGFNEGDSFASELTEFDFVEANTNILLYHNDTVIYSGFSEVHSELIGMFFEEGVLIPGDTYTFRVEIADVAVIEQDDLEEDITIPDVEQ